MSSDGAERQSVPAFGSLIPEGQLRATVKEWLKSDIPKFDVGGFVVGT